LNPKKKKNNLVEDDKHNSKAQLPVLKWNNHNCNITTVEILVVLLQ